MQSEWLDAVNERDVRCAPLAGVFKAVRATYSVRVGTDVYGNMGQPSGGLSRTTLLFAPPRILLLLVTAPPLSLKVHPSQL